MRCVMAVSGQRAEHNDNDHLEGFSMEGASP